MNRRRLTALLLASASTMGLAACGSDGKDTFADTEGGYVFVGDLKYQVHISRRLNPKGVEDRKYLAGLPARYQGLNKDQVWFAVFIRVQNKTHKPHKSAESFKVVDTQGTEYTPVEVDNSYAYQPQLVGSKLQLPDLNSPNYASPTQGELLLFKVKLSSLVDRPLDFEISDDAVKPSEASVELDV